MTTVNRPNIALVDDGGVRDAVKQLLKAHGVTLVSFDSTTDFLTALQQKPFHCLLFAEQATGANGAEPHRTLLEQRLPLPVIVLAEHGSVAMAVEAIKAGAVDVVEKPYEEGRLVEAVRQAVKIYDKWQRNLEGRKRAQELIELLTPREVQVLDMMVEGKPNRQIAQELGISPKTLDIHRANVMHKMQARTSADLVRMRLLDRTDPLGLGYLGN